MSNSPAYRCWSGMIQRCTNPKFDHWDRYGGRGITVCDRWRTFENFYADMGEPPAGMSIDRIDPDGNYCPENCRWATKTEQARNRSTSRLATLNGRTQPLATWAEEYGVTYHLVFYRLKRGWGLERALTTPPRAASRGEGGR